MIFSFIFYLPVYPSGCSFIRNASSRNSLPSLVFTSCSNGYNGSGASADGGGSFSKSIFIDSFLSGTRKKCFMIVVFKSDKLDLLAARRIAVLLTGLPLERRAGLGCSVHERVEVHAPYSPLCDLSPVVFVTTGLKQMNKTEILLCRHSLRFKPFVVSDFANVSILSRSQFLVL